jgi:hypothetical protein
MIGLAMLALFALCAALMYARVLPALLAVPLMALGMAAVAGAGPADLAGVVVGGSVKLAPVFVTVIFGALLSRVTLSTGIAETIVNYAAEFGGDSPALLALALSAAVAVLFTSLTGLGAIIMVGSIVLPIMMTIGVSRRTAATLFMLAFALGYIFNLTQWKFYTTTFGATREQLQPYAYVLAAIDLAALLVFAALRFRLERGYATWALETDEPVSRRRVPAWALLTPVLPIVFYFFLKMDPIIAFALAALYGVVSTRPREGVQTLVAAAIRGIEDVAPAVLLFVGIGMLLATTGLPSVKAALVPLVGALAPRSAIGYVVLFGLLSPLALYRGPLNPFGVGIAVYTVLAGLGVFPAVTLVAAIMAVVQVQNVCDPTNTQNVWVANYAGVRVDEITKLTLPYQVAVATLATLAVVLFGPRLLGTQPFAFASPAVAQTTSAFTPTTASPMPGAMPTGLYAPPNAAQTIAIAPADEISKPAAEIAYREIAGGWTDVSAIALATVPSARDCSTSRYAALLVFRVQLLGGRDGAPGSFDTGLELYDCAGWPVDQWHIVRDVEASPPSTTERERAALAALFRFRTWRVEHPDISAALLEHGLAYAGGSPTYFYSLSKTVDGQMRAFVRPGAPAYLAGLRTNDVVVKLDGKYWWEYGTFQTQRRAYDGQPHTFEITRGNQTLTITLGAPFSLSDLK